MWVPLLALFCLLPFVNSAEALAAGVLLALLLGNPYLAQTKKLTPRLLSASVVGLGAGMNLAVVARVGYHGIGYTVAGISFTLILGTLLGKFFRIQRNTSVLITVGTAICGGSAIAAVAPTIDAHDDEISVSMGTVFILNAAGLFLFPLIGHLLGLTQEQFGIWSALAIHDTSSVVGAGAQYGAQALQIATTIKLARALWIIPVALATSVIFSKHRNGPKSTAKKPWFILGFILMAAIATWSPGKWQIVVESCAKRALVVTLFLIGCNLNAQTIRSVGAKVLGQGVLLWILVASATLWAIGSGLIQAQY